MMESPSTRSKFEGPASPGGDRGKGQPPMISTRVHPEDGFGAKFEELNPLHFLLLLSLAIGATALLSTVLVQGVERSEVEIFLCLLLVYAVASVSFLFSQARSGHFPLFDLPAFLTVFCFLRFALIPGAEFLSPNYRDPYFHRTDFKQLDWTLFLFVLGMLAFWAGCRLTRRKTPPSSSEQNQENTPITEVPLGWAVALFATSLAARIYVTTNYGYGYGMNLDAYFDNLALMQVLSFVADLGFYALVIAAIEVGFHPRSALRKGLFGMIFLNEIFWGALSGMKGNVFRNFLVVALIVSITKVKLDKKWIAAVLAGLIVIYPIHDRYRHLLKTGTVDVRRVGALERAGSTAAQDASREESSWEGWLANGWEQTSSRLDLLHAMATVVSLDSWQASRVRGDERWWMLPFYPFVPRFLWPTKPALLRGMRLSILMGSGHETSSALTYPGDLYLDYGLIGVLLGMFFVGIGGQLITNRIIGQPGKRELFFYTLMFLVVVGVLESDAFLFWASFIKSAVILGVMTYLIYGPRRPKDAEEFAPGAPRAAMTPAWASKGALPPCL